MVRFVLATPNGSWRAALLHEGGRRVFRLWYPDGAHRDFATLEQVQRALTEAHVDVAMLQLEPPTTRGNGGLSLDDTPAG